MNYVLVNLLMVPISAYCAAISTTRFVFSLNLVSMVINILAVAAHMIAQS